MLFDQLQVELMKLQQVEGVGKFIILARILEKVQCIKAHLGFHFMLQFNLI